MLVVPAAAGQTWSMENADAPNTGFLDQATPGDLSGVDAISVGSRVITQVVEGPAGLALAGTLDGRVLALDAAGDVAWEASVPGPMRAAPLWTGTHVIAMPRAGEAVALTPAGETAWTLPVENERSGASLVRMASPTMLPGGDVILADMQGTVYRVAPDGSTVWTHDAGGERAVEATPAIAPDGDVLVASFVPGTEGAGRLERLEAATGKPAWTKQVGSQIVGAPAVVDDTLLVPLRDGDALTARSLADGSLTWSTPFDDHLTSSPSIHEDLAIVGDIRGVLRGLSISDGSEAWSFNPQADDPDLGQVASAGVLTIADSAAVDPDGRVWVPYWNADMTTCCPPTDSRPSPFYLLDAATGELIDRDRFPKAAHGPAIHATGVWAGTDEGTIRSWSVGSTLAIEAFADGQTVTLVTNTGRSGAWTVDWGPAGATSGDGDPPAISTETLPAGSHEITVTVGDASATTTVTVDGSAGTTDPAEDGDETGEQGTDQTGDDGSAPSGDDQAPSEVELPSEDSQDAPVTPLAAILAIALAAWRRRRG